MPCDPEDLSHARQLRRDQTDAESLLWLHLRRRGLAGLKFRRQHAIAGYIVDFYCGQANIAVELDGGGHSDHDQAAYDAERSKRLEERGVRVLRFWNGDVLGNVDGVLQRILEAAGPRTKPPSP